MLHKLVFDTSSAAAMADTHNVGAYVRSGVAGTLITNGQGTADNVASTFDGLDARSFLFGYDAVGANWDRIQQVAGAVKVYIDDGDFEVDVVINAEKAEDSAHASGHIGNYILSVRVDSIVAANAAFLAGTEGDYQSLLTTARGELHVTDVGLANVAITAGSTPLTAGGTEEDVIGSPLVNRKYLWLYNNANRTMFVGPSGVSAADGFPLPPGAYLSMRAGAAIDIEFVSALTGADLRYMELS